MSGGSDKADVYAADILLFELLAGRFAFEIDGERTARPFRKLLNLLL